MSFDKPYPNRKDWRRRYHDSRQGVRSCRAHGGCPWCRAGRTFFDRKARARVAEGREPLDLAVDLRILQGKPT